MKDYQVSCVPLKCVLINIEQMIRVKSISVPFKTKLIISVKMETLRSKKDSMIEYISMSCRMIKVFSFIRSCTCI